MFRNNFNKNYLILESQYFLYFGIMGIFLPYFNLYCYHIGFTGFQIGILSAVRSVMMILCPLFWGILADKSHSGKSIYILCNIISSIIWIFFLYTADFWEIFIISICYGFFYTPIIAFLEAFTIDILGKAKKNYGQIRVWGSISFVISVVLFGYIVDIYSVNIILGFILAGSLIQSLLSIKIPSTPIKKRAVPHQINFLKNKQILFFLLCGVFMLASHGTYYGFFSIHLAKSGFSNLFIGVAWAAGSISEIFIMLNSERIFKRFSLKKVLFFSLSIAVIRWLILSFNISAPVILLTQILHAFTYGTFHIASILYIDLLSPEMNKTLGQAVNNSMTYGFGMMIGFFINGYLFDKIGSHALFLLSSLIAMTALLFFWSFCKVDTEKIT